MVPMAYGQRIWELVFLQDCKHQPVTPLLGVPKLCLRVAMYQKSPCSSMATGAYNLGGEREPHRLLPAPSALSANVFASLTAPVSSRFLRG